MSAPRPEVAPPTVHVTRRGAVPDEAAEYAAAKVGVAVRYAHEPVLGIDVVLSESEDPARERPALAEASLDVNGTQIRAKTAAPDLHKAVDLLEARLRRNLVQHQERVRTRHRWIGLPADHEWRHGDLPTARHDAFPRPPEERQVLRRKTFALAPITVDEAAYEMDLLGHDFYLFVEVVSGHDAVVAHDTEGDDGVHGYVVMGDVVPQPHPDAAVRYDGPAADLTDDQARSRLELSGEPFVFYRDAASGRGRALYLRYDGHYGLITPAA